MKFKSFLGALGVAAAMALAPMGAKAVPVSGQLDITGALSSSSFFGLGNAGVDVDFNPDVATATVATGSFAPVVTQIEALLGGIAATGFDLFDIDFEAGTPFTVYSSFGGFAPAISFTATNYGLFDNDASDGTRGFVANGIISIDGFDSTAGVLAISTQEVKGTATVSFSSTTVVPLPAGVIFLLTALGGLGLVARRRTQAA